MRRAGASLSRMQVATHVTGAGLAAGAGAAAATLGKQAMLAPVALGLVGFFLWFSELSALLLQDYLPLVVIPLGRMFTLPLVQASLPFLLLWAIATGGRHLLGGARLSFDWGLILHGLFALLAIASFLAVADQTPYAREKLLLLLTLNLGSYLAGATFSRAQFARLFGWIMLLGLVVCGMTLFAYVTDAPSLPGRFSPEGMNPIWACRLVLLGAIAGLIAAPVRWWGAAYLAVAIPCALLTGSRGPLVAAAAAALMFGLAWWFAPGRRPIPWSRGLLMAGLAGLVLLLLSSQLPGLRHLGATVGMRLALYQQALGAIAERPLLGLGLGGFQAEVDVAAMGEALAFPHNIFLEVGSELGLLGLLAFGVLACRFLWLGHRHLLHAVAHPDDPTSSWGLAATAGFLFLLAAAQFSGDLISNHSLWFYMGMMSGVAQQRLPARSDPSARQEDPR